MHIHPDVPHLADTLPGSTTGATGCCGRLGRLGRGFGIQAVPGPGQLPATAGRSGGYAVSCVCR